METTEHRLWLCPCNHEARAWLDQQVPGNQFPVGLPPCLARCGLIPSCLPAGLTLHHAVCVSQYLLWVNAIATQACADARHNRRVRLDLARPVSQPADFIYSSALPPIRRIKRVITPLAHDMEDDLPRGASPTAPRYYVPASGLRGGLV